MVVIIIYITDNKITNAGKTVLKIDYRLEEVFVTFVEIDINCHEFKEFNPRTVNRLIQK